MQFQVFFHLQSCSFLGCQVRFDYKRPPSQSSMDASGSSAVSTASGSASSPDRSQLASTVLRALASGAVSPISSTGVSKEIEDLLDTQRQIRAQRAQITKDLKNAQRRRHRLKHKARLLTASDLASVLVLRQEEEETRDSNTKRRRSSQSGQATHQASVNADPVEEGAVSDADQASGEDQPELPAGVTNGSREEERIAA